MWPFHWRNKYGPGRRPWRSKPAQSAQPAGEPASVTSHSSASTSTNSNAIRTEDARAGDARAGDARAEDDRPDQSLWDRAYNSLKACERRLVEEYEILLSEELGDPTGEVVTQVGDASCEINRPRQEQLHIIIDQSLQQLSKRTTYTVAGHEFVVREQISRASELVLWAKDWIGKAASASPEASIAWAGVSVILPLLTNPVTAEEANRDGFAYVTTRMRYYAAFETKLLHGLGENDGVDDDTMVEIATHIVELYQYILDFQIRSVLRFHQGRLKRLGRDAVRLDDWETKLNKIKDLEAVVNRALEVVNAFASRQELESLETTSRQSLIHMGRLLSANEEQLEIAKKQLQIQELTAQQSLSEKEQKCHQLFRLIERNKDVSYEWYKNRVDDRVEGTCQWFLKHEHFIRWSKQESGPLLVSADPGCGKSVLAKHLIDQVLPNIKPTASVCYFFFKDRDQNTARQALCALLHQLFLCKPHLIRHAMPSFTSDGTALASNTMSMWAILESAIRDPEAGSVVFVLDALDECRKSDFLNLIGMLKRLHQDNDEDSEVKTLLTCRPYDHILSEFQELLSEFPYIRIPGEEESETISSEVDLVIKHRVRQLAVEKRLAQPVEEHLLQHLRGIPHRTYLWVYLVFEHLKTTDFKRTVKGVEFTMGSLPETVNQAYEKMLNRSGENERPMVRKAISIILAAYRPLTLSEMNVAMSVEEALESIDDLDLEEEHHFLARLRSWCGLFISVYQGKIYFLHQSAREFLLTANVLPSAKRTHPHRWRHSITPHSAHRVLAGACITYLRIHEPMTTTHGLDGSQDRCTALLAYSAENSMKHFSDAAVDRDDHLVDTAMKLYQEGSKIRSTWRKNFKHASKYLDLTALGMATLFGHTSIVERLLVGGADPKAPERSAIEPHPLHVAANHGRAAIVKLLLDRGVEVDETALHYAIRAGGEQTFQLMLDRLRDVEAAASCLDNLLGRSAEEGHSTLVKLVLEKGSNVNTRLRDGQTPLHLAVLSAHKAAAEQLLNHGADIEAKNDTGNTPLLCAISRNYHGMSGRCEEVVQLLLDRGAATETRNGEQGWTALSLAAALGHVGTIQLLLHYDADIEGKGLNDQTPLACASSVDYKVAEVLLTAGANVEARDAIGRTPLHSAVDAWKVNVVELLLDHGANTEAKDEKGQTPLHLAAEAGEADVVELLLERGADREAKDLCGETPLDLAEKEASCFADHPEEGLAQVISLLRDEEVEVEGVYEVEAGESTLAERKELVSSVC